MVPALATHARAGRTAAVVPSEASIAILVATLAAPQVPHARALAANIVAEAAVALFDASWGWRGFFLAHLTDALLARLAAVAAAVASLSGRHARLYASVGCGAADVAATAVVAGVALPAARDARLHANVVMRVAHVGAAAVVAGDRVAKLATRDARWHANVELGVAHVTVAAGVGSWVTFLACRHAWLDAHVLAGVTHGAFAAFVVLGVALFV